MTNAPTPNNESELDEATMKPNTNTELKKQIMYIGRVEQGSVLWKTDGHGVCEIESKSQSTVEIGVDDLMSLIDQYVQQRVTEAQIKVLEETMPHTDGMRHYNTVIKRIAKLEASLNTEGGE